MNNKNKKKKTIYPSFDKHLARELKDPELKKYFDEYGKQLEISYKILQLRKKQKLSQKDLAKKLKTTQSAIARMEAGEQNLTIETLQKVASAFDYNLKVDFVR